MAVHRPMLVGITGGIGAGKSTVCRIFSILKTPLYSSDIRAKWLMENDDGLVNRIKNIFGNESYNQGKIDRKYLAGDVFTHKEKLSKLNELVHPAVSRDFSVWVQHNSKYPYIIKEAALLFESGSYKKLDFVIDVYAPENLRIQRVLKRDSFRNKAEISSIMKSQFDDKKRLELADFRIINDDSELIIPQVLGLHRNFLDQLS